MGYYKKLSLESNRKSRRIQGTTKALNDNIQVTGVHEIMKALDLVAQAGKLDRKRLKSIHRNGAKIYERAFKKAIFDSATDIKVYDGEGNVRAIVKKGTYKRSIRTWQIDKNSTTYYVGPAVGRRAPEDSDAWFSHIVEGGDQYIKGTTRNHHIIEKIQAQKKEAVKASLLKAYRKWFPGYVATVRKQASSTGAGKQLKLF